MNRQLKETIITVAALAAYGTIFLCLVGAVLFIIFGLFAVWGLFYDLLT